MKTRSRRKAGPQIVPPEGVLTDPTSIAVARGPRGGPRASGNDGRQWGPSCRRGSSCGERPH